MAFPDIRMRARRKNEATRRRYREIPGLSHRDLIMPIFVKEGLYRKKEIKSMPGIYQFGIKEAVSEAGKIHDLGISSIILFGIPKHKNAIGSSAYDERGIVQETIRAIKKKLPSFNVIGDVCMCEYTSHGHCGIIKGKDKIDNARTIKVLAKIALSYARAGADMVAPSAMMDRQVKEIRELLTANDFSRVKIMSYSAKYASGFYGPFRNAAGSPPQFGDRKAYQMDYYNSDEAIIEAKLDIAEGADIVMVKPALGYQDIIYRIKKELNFPLACYSVSGEYSMIKAAGRGAMNERAIVLETLTGFKRAGADLIITYYAKAAAKWLKSSR